jgi:hypothetical protein
VITTVTLTSGLDSYCRDLKAKLQQEPVKNDGKHSASSKYDAIARHMSDYMYGHIMKILGRGVNTFVVSPAIQKASEAFSNRRQSSEESQALVPGGVTDSLRLGDAYKKLGLRPGASESDVNARFRQVAFEHHPDRCGFGFYCFYHRHLFLFRIQRWQCRNLQATGHSPR